MDSEVAEGDDHVALGIYSLGPSSHRGNHCYNHIQGDIVYFDSMRRRVSRKLEKDLARIDTLQRTVIFVMKGRTKPQTLSVPRATHQQDSSNHK